MLPFSLLRPLFLLSFLLPVSAISAQGIFSNPITDSDPSSANPYASGQTVDNSLTASGIGRGSGISANAGSNRYNANSWNTGALDGTAYFTFTLTPFTGKKINFASFTYTGQTSSSGPVSFAFRSSVDGFTANLGAPDADGVTISLSGAAFQNIKTPITFRLYAWGASGATGTFSVNDFAFNGAVVLPVELLYVRARAVDDQVSRLSFATATERNNAYFSIERSQDGLRFEPIGKVSGAGTSTVQHDYTFTDEHPVKGLNFYRLQQVDFDGQFSYSPVVSVLFGQTGGLHLAPQPVLDQLQVSLEQATEQDGQWQVYDFAGRLLQAGSLQAESSGFQIPTVTFTPGSYVLRVVSGVEVMTRQFQKQ